MKSPGIKNSDISPYDIFISYRKIDGYEYALMLQKELEKRGLSIFVDDEDLGNGPFHGGVFLTIENTPIFLVILSPSYFDGIDNDKDWVAKELNRAIESKRTICLVNPNHLFPGIPENAPDSIKKAIVSLQIWDVAFEGYKSSSFYNFINHLINHVIKRDTQKTPLFVSYSRFDKDVVIPFIERLEKELNIQCWIDLEGIKSGDQFEDQIISAIDKAEVVLFMLSDNALQSKWTKREVLYAECENKRIIPIVTDGKGLRGWFKFHFGNVHYENISSESDFVHLISNLRSWISNVQSHTGDLCGHTWVDLGIGVKWSSVNIGAIQPADAGFYFAWGETQSKLNYTWENYKYGIDSAKLNKYIPIDKSCFGENGFVDEKTVLDDCDDAARLLWGDSWRTPTAIDFLHLLEFCDKAWLNQNGRMGWLFTSKINGESIFLPAAGFFNETTLDELGSLGRYWTASVDADNPSFAWSLFFNSTSVHRIYGTRCSGLTIRPVTDLPGSTADETAGEGDVGEAYGIGKEGADF